MPLFFYIFRAWPYIFHPQLFAEDGRDWLANAHNNPLGSFLAPYAGSLHTFERAWSILINLFPLTLSPILYNLTAFAIFSILVIYLFSDRTKLFKSNYQKVFVSICLCLMVNVQDFYFNFSNSIFLLGIVGVLIIISNKPKKLVIEIFEKIIYLLMCFTLPFAWIYFLILTTKRVVDKSKNNFFLFFAALGSFAQLMVHFFYNNRPDTLSPFTLGSRFALLVIYNQVIIPAFRFSRFDLSASSAARISGGLTLLLACIATGCLVILALYKSTKNMRYFLIFLMAMAFGAISNPQITASTAREGYILLANTVGGSRYWIFGILIIFISVSIVSEAVLKRKYRYYFLIIFFSFSLLTSIMNNNFFIDKHFIDYSTIYSDKIEQVKYKGPPLKIPENPGAPNWVITLNRK